MKKLCLLLAFLMVILTGCAVRQDTSSQITESIKVYYAAKGNTGLGTEYREIKYKEQEEKYKKAIEELLKGPTDVDKFETSIRKSTRLLDLKVEDGNIILNFSKEFQGFSGALHEAAVVSSAVDTILQFGELKKAKILVEGKDLIAPSGKPYGFMEFIDFNITGMVEKEINLYFGDDQAMSIVPEKRTIQVKQDITREELYKLVLEELIKGPTTKGLHKTIPEAVIVNSVKIEDDLVSVDFSNEMHTKHWRGATGEGMTITSIIDTLTQFQGVNRVMPTVNGGPMFIEHMIVEAPLTKSDATISTQ